jgi:hypothetical protein
MLSDRDVREIEEGRRRGTAGPVLMTWVERLLADRRERLQQLAHARMRLEQAYRYIDKLLGSLDPGAETARDPRDGTREGRRR